MANHNQMTNAELLKRHTAKQALKKELKGLEAQIRPVQKRISTLQRTLESVGEVTDVVKGVCLKVFRDSQGRWDDAYTVAFVAKGARRVHLYQRVNTEFWAVRVNQGFGFHERFNGGRALGLAERWSYRQALTIGKRWLTGDEAVLTKW